MPAATSTLRDSSPPQPSKNRQFAVGLARAVGGAILFSLPLLMTMEMWWLGFCASPLRLALFALAAIPLLIGLSHYSGFEETFDFKNDAVDAFVACAVGAGTSAGALFLFHELTSGMAATEIAGKIAIQTIPAAVGALLAVSQFGSADEKAEEKERFTRYDGELFLMAVGALFLSLNVAPTEEMILIAFKMTAWHALGLVLVSLVVMHAFVYAVEFCGQHTLPAGTSHWSGFARYTVPGYAIALGISLYILWTFGRTDGMSAHEIAMTAVVLGFPAAIGAAAARLVI